MSLSLLSWAMRDAFVKTPVQRIVLIMLSEFLGSDEVWKYLSENEIQEVAMLSCLTPHEFIHACRSMPEYIVLKELPYGGYESMLVIDRATYTEDWQTTSYQVQKPRPKTDTELRREEWNRKKKDIRWKVFARDGEVCRYCQSTENLAIDHLIPMSRGGTDELDNLAVCCRSCNSSKGTKTPEEWQVSR